MWWKPAPLGDIEKIFLWKKLNFILTSTFEWDYGWFILVIEIVSFDSLLCKNVP